MINRKISPHQLENYFQELVGRKLSNFYYLTDTTLVFESGEKFEDKKNILHVKGKRKPVYKSEYELWIWGNWKYLAGGTIIETSNPKPKEVGSNFRHRMGEFIESLHPKNITSISLTDDGKKALIKLDIGGHIEVHPHGKGSFLNYSNYILDANGNQTKARHAGSDRETGMFFYSESP